VVQAAQEFGFSRPSFYQAQSAFTKEGLSGLMPRKRGPRTRHKVTDEVMKFIEALCTENPSIRPKDLAKQVQAHFGMKVHQRSIERAIGDKKKR
jgi:transposase